MRPTGPRTLKQRALRWATSTAVAAVAVNGLAAPTARAQTAASAGAATAASNAAAFGPKAAASPDIAVDAFGDGQGYHIQVSHERSGFSWHEIAVLRPAGMDEAGW